jgi:hypothetical protein
LPFDAGGVSGTANVVSSQASSSTGVGPVAT